MDTVIFPNGPSISTVEPVCALLVLAPVFCWGGVRIRKETSGGSDKGAPPILERHGAEVEKDEVLCEKGWKAGSKKEGMETSVACGLMTALRQRHRADENMVSA